jgi:hypothetical protein
MVELQSPFHDKQKEMKLGTGTYGLEVTVREFVYCGKNCEVANIWLMLGRSTCK